MYSFLTNKKILITGSSGYIGSKLLKKLLNFNCKIFIIVRNKKLINKHLKKEKKIFFLTGNITKKIFWEKNIKNMDYLIHLASNESKFGKNINFFDNFNVNVNSLLYALFFSKKYNKNIKIISIGSENQLGIAKKIPVNDESKDKPLTIFGINKLIAEQYLNFYKKSFNIDSISLRLSNVYGPSGFQENILKVSLNKMISNALNEKIILYNNQNSIRDFIFIDDVINAIILAMKNIKKLDQNYYYIGSGKGYSLKKISEIITKQVIKYFPTKKISKIQIRKKMSDFDKRNFVANIKKFKKITGWSPKISLLEGIKNTIFNLIKIKT